ncbi:GNAT family N-acetyltransferase [Paenibacillus typhae]|uniref:Acetyltransferase (GNAT) family protein n=2 Tax=Paenibacillus typhae TaxID=1174501 RepID=A0A1G9EHB5_9BACL|nr:Acetyltransferase (GNAT) family protein [Paenibacillus typhae]
MTHATMEDYNKPNEEFPVTGRILLRYESGEWTYTEETLAEPYMKRYADEELDAAYIEEDGKAVFLYYDGADCSGRIRLRTNWNGYAMVEEIGVAGSRRQQGIGTRLMDRGVEWAQQHKLAGLMLETQDVNAAACRFYARYGFVIGGADNMLYSGFPAGAEQAIFWYYKFQEKVLTLR